MKIKEIFCVFADLAYLFLSKSAKQIINQDLDVNTKYKTDFKYQEGRYFLS